MDSGLSRRQTEIIALLRETGRVAVEDLAARFDVSPQTIRRDLNDMSDARVIGQVLHAGGDDGAAMHAGDDARLAHFIQVAADGLRRDVEPHRQFLHLDAA